MQAGAMDMLKKGNKIINDRLAFFLTNQQTKIHKQRKKPRFYFITQSRNVIAIWM